MAVYDDEKTEGQAGSANSNSTSGKGFSYNPTDGTSRLKQPFGSNSTGSKSVSPNDLQQQEKNAGASDSTGDYSNDEPTAKEESLNESSGGGDDRGSLWSDSSNSSKTKKTGRFRLTRRNVAIGGTLTGLVIGGGFGILSIIQGPMEFVHIAQLLEKFHFTSLEDTEDGRLMRIARYIKDPSKPQNTRLGTVGNSLANKLEKTIQEKTGLIMEYDSLTGEFKGYKVDKESSRYKDMSNREIIGDLTKTYGISESSIGILQRSDGNPDLRINPEKGGISNSVRDYYAQTRFNRSLLKEAGLSRLSARIGTRVLTERANWTFHPIKKLDTKIRDAALKKGKSGIDQLREKYKQAKVKYITSGVETYTIDARDGSEKDSNGASKDPGAGEVASDANSLSSDVEAAANETNEGKDGVKGLHDKLSVKVAGSAAGAAGVLCIGQALSDKYDADKEAKAILPMMRMAGDSLSLGSQVMDGRDIDMTQLGFAKESLDAKDSKGNITSTWNQATSIRAEEGKGSLGDQYDIPKSGQVFKGNIFQETLSQIPGLNTVCSALNSPIGLVFSVVTGPVSTLVGAVASGPILGLVSGWLSGTPVNPLAAGADYGNYINYGSKLASNQAFSAVGGVALDAADVITLKDTQNALDKEEFESNSLAYKLLDPYDSRTAVAQFIDSQGNTSVPQKFAITFRGFGNIFGSVVSKAASLFTGLNHTKAASNYDYHGVKTIGFRPDELTNPTYENPFENGCYVTGCHDSKRNITGIFEDSSKASHYTDLAKKCFGVEISNNAGAWEINSKTRPVPMYTTDYPSAECASKDKEWTRVRFWLLDTGTIENFDCYDSSTPTSDQSCTDAGLTSSNSQDSSGDSATTGISGNGSGQFTTDTSHTPYPGLDQMLARVGAAKNASGAASFCASIGGCSGRCESAIEMAWLGHRGQYSSPFGNAGNTPSQGTAWAAALASGHAHPGDRNPPVGALLIYNIHNPNDPWGHITIYLGNNLVFSTDFDHQGSVGVQPASHIETGSWANSYVGWMDPYFSGKVGN